MPTDNDRKNISDQCADMSGLIHQPVDGSPPTRVADRVYRPESIRDRLIGLGQLARGGAVAVVFSWETTAKRRVSMVGMPFAIDVIWLTARRVARTARMGPWTGTERSPADTVIELPTGHAADIVPGDQIEWDG